MKAKQPPVPKKASQRKRAKSKLQLAQKAQRAELNILYTENFLDLAKQVVFDPKFIRRMKDNLRIMESKYLSLLTKASEPEKTLSLLRRLGPQISEATGFAGAAPKMPAFLAAFSHNPIATSYFIMACLAKATNPEAIRSLAVRQLLVDGHNKSVRAANKDKKRYRDRETNKKTGHPLSLRRAEALKKHPETYKDGKPMSPYAAQKAAARLGLESGMRFD